MPPPKPKMNNFISAKAVGKLQSLIDRVDATGCLFSSWPDGGVDFDYLFSFPLNDSIMIFDVPKIFVNNILFGQLGGQIDFDDRSEEFIITREK